VSDVHATAQSQWTGFPVSLISSTASASSNEHALIVFSLLRSNCSYTHTVSAVYHATRPHYALHSASVRLSVWLSVPGQPLSRQRNIVQRSKLSGKVISSRSNWQSNFEVKKLKGQGHWGRKCDNHFWHMSSQKCTNSRETKTRMIVIPRCTFCLIQRSSGIAYFSRYRATMDWSFAEIKRLNFGLSPEFRLSISAARITANSIMSSLTSSLIFPYLYVYLWISEKVKWFSFIKLSL